MGGRRWREAPDEGGSFKHAPHPAPHPLTRATRDLSPSRGRGECTEISQRFRTSGSGSGSGSESNVHPTNEKREPID